LTNILPLDDTNGSVKNLTLFLSGLALLQSPRTKYSIAWLEILRPVTRHHRKGRTSTTFPKTSHLCNVSKSTYKICTSKLNDNSPTTLRLPHQLPSISTEARVKQMKESTTMPNHDPRMNRTNPKYRELIGILVLEVPRVISAVTCCLPCVFWVMFAVALCVSWLCIVTLCMCLFLPLGLKNPRVYKTLNRKPL
jgi:hypothetical protein